MIEIQTFNLRSGAGEAVFLEADARAQTEFYYRQPGLLRRTTARSPDGEWLVVLLWDSDDDAEAADRRAGEDPAATELVSLMDGLAVKRYSTID